MQATITSKGQITLPKTLRDQLQLQTGDKIEFVIDEQGHIEMLPVTASVKKLKGMVPKPSQPVSLDNMETAIAKGSSKR